MSQADGYVRIVTQNDVSEAQRSTEQLGDTIHDALDTTPANNMTQAVNAVQNATEQLGGSVQNSMDTAPADNMTGAIGGLEDGISDTGEAALKTGDIIKANLVSEAVTQGIQKLGDVLKNSASRTIEIADGLDSSVNKIAAATNASAEEVNRLRSIVEQIYGDNFGEGFDDIADSISKIKQNLGKLDDKELVKVTESAYALKDVFDYDIAESSRAVKAMMENFGVSASEAYDYIARGAQNGLDYSGELLDNISEYSVQFKKMGLSASDMFTIFSNGAENGAWNLDKIGDSVKELAIRVIDGSDTSKQGFEALGFEADSMAEKFAAGGVSARVAFQEVIAALAEMNDPIAQNTAGINLMGTMWEDMGAEAVLALGDISDSAFDCAGAMDAIKDVNYNSLSNSLENVQRQIDLLIQPIGESLIPVLDEAADSVAEIAQKGDLKEIAVNVGSFISGTLTLLLKNINLIAAAIAGVTAAVIAFKTANMLTKVIASWQTAALQVTLLGNAQGAAAIKSAALKGELTAQEIVYAVLSGKLDVATAKQIALNTAMNMNPAGIIAVAVGLLATALTGFAISAGTAESAAKELNDAIDQMHDSVESSIADNEAEMSVLKDKVKRYDELRTAVSLTSDEQKELSTLAQELQSVLGDEVTVVDQLTGKYNDLTDAVDTYVQKKTASVKLSAYEQAAAEAYNIKRNAENKLKELNEKYGGLNSDDYFAKIKATATVFSDYGNTLAAGQQFEADVKAAQKAIEEADKTISEWQSLASESYKDGITASGTKTPASTSSKQTEPANSLPDYWKQKSEDFKYWKESYKYDYDMGRISAEEYYTTLASLRDEFLENESDEWRSVNVEIKKYYDSLSEEQKKAYEKRLEEQKKADEEAKKAAEQAAAEAIAARKAAYSEEKSQLEFKLKTNHITEKKYYSELAKLRDKYLDKNSAEWRSAFLETYEYNQKMIQANKDALEQLLNDASDTTLSALEKIVSARDSLTAKLTDFNKTFEKVTETIPETVAVKGDFTITTAEHDVETYKMGADSIEDNIKVLEEYGAMLDALKARGADESTLSSILNMDIEEGMEFGSKLLNMSDQAWNSYFDSLERLHKTAAEISAKYYQDEVNSLKENFVDKLRSAFDGMTSDMYQVGFDTAKAFVEGWNKQLGTEDLTLGDIAAAVSGGTLSTAPVAAQSMSAAGTVLNGAAKLMSQIVNVPVYIGTQKLADIMVDVTNGKIIQTGKNVLMT
jgi:phage-related minor tail protein|nr:MAG TPA: minor tail protein [Caudoviricetes sp.]